MIIFFARHLIVIVTHVCSLQLAAHAGLCAVITEDDDDAMARLPARRGTQAKGRDPYSSHYPGANCLARNYHLRTMKVNIAPEGTGSG